MIIKRNLTDDPKSLILLIKRKYFYSLIVDYVIHIHGLIFFIRTSLNTSLSSIDEDTLNVHKVLNVKR